MTNLNKQQLKKLRQLAHKERSILQIGKQGLTEPVIYELNGALERRELVKLNVLQNSPEELEEVSNELADKLNATIVQMIGNTAVLYRPSSKEKNQKITAILEEV